MKAPGWWVIALVFFALGMLAGPQPVTPQTNERLTLAQSLGRYVVAQRALVGLTQDSFVKLLRGRLPTFAIAQLSDVERGRVVAGDGTWQALVLVLDSVEAVRLDPRAADSLWVLRPLLCLTATGCP